MSTLWPLILDQRVPYKKLVTLLIFKTTFITTMEVFRNKAKGLAEKKHEVKMKWTKTRNKKKGIKSKKQKEKD